jgi:hypothetical protein
MQKPILFALGILAASGLLDWNYPLAQTENRQALRTTDKTGCYLTNGSFTGPTIVLAAGLYHEPEFPKERAIKIIRVALSSGCSIDEPDEVGSTPLVASIIYNEPELTKILLDSGANPYLKISSTKKYLDGLDAFQILHFLIENQPSKDRNTLRQLLEQYKRKA